MTVPQAFTRIAVSFEEARLFVLVGSLMINARFLSVIIDYLPMLC
ncbi:hypothetical protein NOC27_771 [Nitrosococcus oceani AFC27]|nr:hypothetical protein NOC27_771 [Nitrosococcus oceani AFC27]